MTSIMATLKATDGKCFFTKSIYYFTFTFITPLQAKDKCV
jgi:hypothetical protein